jgi:hypothetical protein
MKKLGCEKARNLCLNEECAKNMCDVQVVCRWNKLLSHSAARHGSLLCKSVFVRQDGG